MKINANGFTVELPAGWDDRSMITLVGPVGADGFAANVVITRERVDARTSIEDYAHAQRAAMEEEVATLEILDERATNVDGAPAFQRLQRFEIEGERIQQVQTFILAGEIIFVVTGTASIADFDANIDAFRRVAETFRRAVPGN